MRTEIEAYGPNLTKLEVKLSNADGSVVSQRTEIQSQVEYDENIQEIALTSSNVRNESDDDTDDALDDTDDALDDTDIDDDLDENHDSSGSDDNDSNDVDGHDSDGHDNESNDGDDD
jgi:hypothetical protein